MRSTNWKDIAELVGIAAIVASLMFVGLEMRQTRVIALANTYQARTDSELLLSSLNLHPEIDRVITMMGNGEEFSSEDLDRLHQMLTWRFIYLENVHYQLELEMLSQEQWEAQLLGIYPMLVNPNFRQWWDGYRQAWRPSFSRDIDEFLAELDSRNQ